MERMNTLYIMCLASILFRRLYNIYLRRRFFFDVPFFLAAAFAGIFRLWPIRMFVLLPMPFADWIAATVVPYLRAIFSRVSPLRTLWLVVFAFGVSLALALAADALAPEAFADAALLSLTLAFEAAAPVTAADDEADASSVVDDADWRNSCALT